MKLRWLIRAGKEKVLQYYDEGHEKWLGVDLHIEKEELSLESIFNDWFNENRGTYNSAKEWQKAAVTAFYIIAKAWFKQHPEELNEDGKGD